VFNAREEGAGRCATAAAEPTATLQRPTPGLSAVYQVCFSLPFLLSPRIVRHQGMKEVCNGRWTGGIV
jgi:hypothetical protein